MRRRASRGGGFNLVELMITVVILGILAAIATVSYRKYIARARVSEAAAVLAEMASKEELYKYEFAAYLPLRGDASIVMPATDESTAAFYPADPIILEPRLATTIGDQGGWPQAWRTVGMKPKYNEVYCTYATNAGRGLDAGEAITGVYGRMLVGATSTTPWYYSLAVCNLDGAASWTPSLGDKVSVFGISSVSAGLRSFNDGQ